VKEMRVILVYMAVFLGGTVAVCAALFEPLRGAFLANEIFNAMILVVLVVGIALNVRQVLHVAPALGWLQSFRNPRARLSVETRPALLAPMQRLLTSIHEEGFRLPAPTMRAMLDSIRLRLDESRELSRYMTGLLIFLGLLGTFWGLLDTVDSVGAVISGLSAGEDIGQTFVQLKADLQGPLAGMGTAFSSSLFGLGGALILGFFDLQAGHAQNRFYNHLEEWLSDLVHLPSSAGVADTDAVAAPGYTDALLEHTAERLAEVGRLLARGEAERRQGHEQMLELTTRIAELTEQLRGEERLLEEIARTQLDLKPVVERLVDLGRADAAQLDHLRSLDSALSGVRAELAAGRDTLSAEVRDEIRLLARAMARSQPSAGSES
jgi:hypothetical protein